MYFGSLGMVDGLLFDVLFLFLFFFEWCDCGIFVFGLCGALLAPSTFLFTNDVVCV